MTLKVKICGITRLEDAQAALRLGAWAIGFVFHPKSPRFISPVSARGIGESLHTASLLRVGVFMDQPEEEILGTVEKANLDLIQLHGAESPALVERLGRHRCIKATTQAEKTDAAYMLFDRPRTPGRPGSGSLDLEKASALARTHPQTLLAGGLSAENVEDAVRHVRPWGVDISSGVESSAGIKNADKLSAFFNTLRAFESLE